MDFPRGVNNSSGPLEQPLVGISPGFLASAVASL